MIEAKELEKIAVEVRKKLLEIIHNAGGGHTGGSLSSVDILVALYFEILNIDPKNPKWDKRDWFIMSKGHSVESYFTVLSKRGFFSQDVLNTYGQFKSILAGHPTRNVPGIEINSGALGHGLSVGVGLAIAANRSAMPNKAYVLMGDGEQAEGSVMEAAATAGHYKLSNLIGIVDRNNLQISGKTEDVMAIEDLAAKYKACGWAVKSCNGHNLTELVNIFKKCPFEENKPSLIIARTIKGKGVSFMENKAGWHHKVPDADELEKSIAELKLTREKI